MVRCGYNGEWGKWSDEVEVTTEKKWWKKCPYFVDKKRRYAIDEKNPRIATKIGYGDYYCTIIGDAFLPRGKVTSSNIKVLKSKYNNGANIFIGVAPSNIDQNESDNRSKCGWYFYCHRSTLCSGPPHNYMHPGKPYGLKKEDGQYVQTIDRVGVVMDTRNGELSFVLNGVNLGVAFEEIPLGKPLAPCVLLRKQDDSIELVI